MSNYIAEGATEHGSNQFGQFIKFQNGVMLCWRKFLATPTYVSTWGSMYYYAIFGWQYAANFTEKPVVFVYNTDGNTFLIGQIQVDEWHIIKCELMRAVNDTSQSEFEFLAIGRWK